MSDLTAGSNDQYQPADVDKSADRDLKLQVDLLNSNAEMNFRDTLAVVARGWSFIRLFKGRYFVRWVLNMVALLYPVFVLPWGVKIVIDHVVLNKPITNTDGYPGWLHPLIEFFMGMPPIEVMGWLTVIALFLVAIFGGYAPGGASDTTDAGMAEGMDTATRQENMTHGGFSFVGGLWGYFEYKLNSRLTQAVNHLVRSKLFARIKAMPMTLLDDQRIGDSVFRVMYDAPSINQIFYEVVNRPTLSTLIFICAVYNLSSAYPDVPEVVWFSAMLFPLYFLLTAPFSAMVRRRHQASRKAGSAVTSTIEEGMDNVLAVQSLGGNEREKARFGSDSDESFKKFRGTVFVGILIGQVMGLAQVLVVALVSWFVLTNVIDGRFTPGDFGALLFYFASMRGPAVNLATLWIHLQEHAVGMRRVFALMDLPQEEDIGTRELKTVESGIRFKEAGLVYPDGRRALNQISFAADVGQIIAFSGPTGAGKTSLAHLLPRYHLATEGRVLIDGYDVRDLTMQSLRDQITYVFQETQLSSESIRDNIRFGKPDATQQEVERVATIAGIHDFIVSLPDGYDTRLGTTSSKLSVGQKQRISIARGLLRESRILILDEPTSALDPETEKYLVQALHEAARDRLVIIIAHRLSTIRQADVIVFLKDGNVAEQGSHDELMDIADGEYRAFVELQTQTAA